MSARVILAGSSSFVVSVISWFSLLVFPGFKWGVPPGLIFLIGVLNI